MSHCFWLPLSDIQPSQLYVSKGKLARVWDWWRPPHLKSFSALPVKRLKGRVIFTDGHTRAFAAYQMGFQHVPVYWDEDALDWEAYQICVDWCLDANIQTVMDLAGRMLTPEDYQHLWLDRCQTMQTALARRRQSNGIS